MQPHKNNSFDNLTARKQQFLYKTTASSKQNFKPARKLTRLHRPARQAQRSGTTDEISPRGTRQKTSLATRRTHARDFKANSKETPAVFASNLFDLQF
jgi:hypothetical protein